MAGRAASRFSVQRPLIVGGGLFFAVALGAKKVYLLDLAAGWVLPLFLLGGLLVDGDVLDHVVPELV